VQKGEMIGIIGPSGAGKTTLVDILLRLLKPQNGIILADDVDIDSIDLDSWHKNVGYVSQDIFLLNDTIEANIKFYSNSVSQNDVIAASKMANIYDFIQELPNKFDTPTGERGVKLSGGQKQRIALARTLARKPSILILDEATSALDNESEKRIQEVIENLKGKMTVLVIAHRLGTVMNCDNLLVLDKGKIIEEGKPQELLKDKESYFFKMYNIRK
jgi:ABC-type multidrug transport system fused ATPase/permease subunit